MDNNNFSSNILGRYFCNTLQEAEVSHHAKPFDVVVIGSGMYGAYIASKLYYWSQKQLGFEKRLKILILEAGPYITHEHIENLPPRTGIFDQGSNLPHMKSPYISHVHRAGMDEEYFGEVTKHNYCVGGKSLAWGKWSPRLIQQDLDLWPQEVGEFLLENYDKVEDETGVSDYSDLINGTLFKSLKSLLGDKLGLLNLNHLTLIDPPIAVATSSTVSGLFSPDAFSSLGILLQNIRVESEFPDVANGDNPSKSIFLVPNTLAYKLETDRGRVSRINVVDVNSKQASSFDISPQCDVILAGTAIESTRLALNSFPRSIDSAQELMGRNLMAHLFSPPIIFRIKRAALQLAETEILESALFHIQGYSERFQKSYHFQLFSNSDPNFWVSKTLYKMFYDLEAAQDALLSQDMEWVTILVLSCAEVPGKPKSPIYTDDSNWMDLSNQIEEFGEVKYPKPYLKWQSSSEDEDFWDEVLANLFDCLFSLAPSGDIQYRDPNNNNNWLSAKPAQFDQFQKSEAFWNSRHESGTLWMGENAEESVTDLDGKLHHVQNVYCGDQALFPTVGSANPVLTGLTLDRKLAQAMIDRYQDFADDYDLNGFQPLFDGTTFDGWEIQNKGEYLILSDGILELKPQNGHGIAWYKGEFSEFDLILDWKVFDDYANSGIVIHAPDPAMFPEHEDNPLYEGGYEIQIDESGYDYKTDISMNNGNPSYRKEFYGSPSHKTGAIYNLAPANRGNTKKPGFWNRFRITSTKSDLKVYLNGKLVSSLSPLLEDKNTEGYICLQFHTSKIQFRNILIREH